MTQSQTESATDLAYRTIRDDILDGVHASGTMLGEANLASQMGMSRTPVRTALVRLQDEGWVQIYPKRGALVQGLSERAVTDLADARLILEVASVQRASTDTREALAGLLERAIEDQIAAFRDEDIRRFIELTIAFHRSFVESSRNDVLVELYSRLADRQRFVLFSQGQSLLAQCESIISEHRELVLAMREGDTTRFSDVLRTHFRDSYGRPLDPICPLGGRTAHPQR